MESNLLEWKVTFWSGKQPLVNKEKYFTGVESNLLEWKVTLWSENNLLPGGPRSKRDWSTDLGPFSSPDAAEHWPPWRARTWPRPANKRSEGLVKARLAWALSIKVKGLGRAGLAQSLSIKVSGLGGPGPRQVDKTEGRAGPGPSMQVLGWGLGRGAPPC